MKLTSILIAAMCCAAPIFATTIALPFNTGVNSNGVVAAAGSIDQHYSSSQGQVYVESSLPSTWVGPNSLSAWVGPDTSNGSSLSNGVYNLNYTVSFYIGNGIDPATVSLTGLVAADDLVDDIRVNGNTNQVYIPYAYESFTPFTLTNGFQAGLNVIDFNYSDFSGAGGIRVEFTGVDTTPEPAFVGLKASATPEPASIALLGFGVAGLGLIRRKKKQ